jgi:hypothetical protein
MRIVMQKVLRICNTWQNLAFLQQHQLLRAPHGYARLDPDT